MTTEASIIMGAALRLRIGKQKELADRMGLKSATLSAQLKEPGGIPFRTLRQYVEATKMSDEEIVRLVRGKGNV